MDLANSRVVLARQSRPTIGRRLVVGALAAIAIVAPTVGLSQTGPPARAARTAGGFGETKKAGGGGAKMWPPPRVLGPGGHPPLGIVTTPAGKTGPRGGSVGFFQPPPPPPIVSPAAVVAASKNPD